MKEVTYWSHAEFDEHGQYIATVTEDQIIDEYWCYWMQRMRDVGKEKEISRQRCIEDWCIVHWAYKSDKDGNPYE